MHICTTVPSSSGIQSILHLKVRLGYPSGTSEQFWGSRDTPVVPAPLVVLEHCGSKLFSEQFTCHYSVLASLASRNKYVVLVSLMVTFNAKRLPRTLSPFMGHLYFLEILC